MKEIRSAIAALTKLGDTPVAATELANILRAVDDELTALRVLAGLAAHKARVTGPDLEAAVANFNVGNGHKKPGVTIAVRDKVYEAVAALDEPIDTSLPMLSPSEPHKAP